MAKYAFLVMTNTRQALPQTCQRSCFSGSVSV